LAEDVVRDACVCEGREGRVLLPERQQVQVEVRDVRLQRRGEPGRRRHVADLLRAEEADRQGRGEDRRAREEGGALRTGPSTASALAARRLTASRRSLNGRREAMKTTTVTTQNELEIRVERVFDAVRAR